MTMSSTSNSSSSSSIELALPVDIDGCDDELSSSSSAEYSQLDTETISFVAVTGDARSHDDGIAIDVADAGGGLAKKNEDAENGSYTELSTAVCMKDSESIVAIVSSKNRRRPKSVSTRRGF